MGKVSVVIETINRWSKNNDITLNKSKTKILRINRNCPRIHKVEPKTGLEFVKSYKYLGFNIDGKLTISSELNKLFKNFWKKCWRIRNIRNCTINWDCRIKIWLSLIRSRYHHLLVPLALCGKLVLLKKLWGRTLAACLGLKKPNYSKMLSSLLLESPEISANRKLVKLVTKIRGCNRDIPNILIKKTNFNALSFTSKSLHMQNVYLQSIGIKSNRRISNLQKILWYHKYSLMYRIGYLFRKTRLCRCGENISPLNHYKDCLFFNFKSYIDNKCTNIFNLNNNTDNLIRFLQAGEYLANANTSNTLNTIDDIIMKFLLARN